MTIRRAHLCPWALGSIMTIFFYYMQMILQVQKIVNPIDLYELYNETHAYYQRMESIS